MYNNKLDRVYKSLIIFAIIILAFIYAGNLIMPILFAGLLAIVLSPICTKLEKKGLSRGLSAFITILLIAFFIAGLLTVVIIQSQEIIKDFPNIIKNKKDLFDLKNLNIQSTAILEYIEEHISTIDELIQKGQQYLIGFTRSFLSGFVDTLSFFVLIPIYIFFFLLNRKQLSNFIHKWLAEHYEENGGSQEIVQNIKSSLFHYLKGLLSIMTISGTLTFIGLYFIGLEYALFMGTLTALLTPIPYIGVTISAFIPITLALLTKDSLWYVGGVIIVFAIVQFTENYILTPKIMGKSVNVNPMIIVIALFVFGSILGVLGMIMTVPIMAIVKVITNKIPNLKAWDYLLEDQIAGNEK